MNLKTATLIAIIGVTISTSFYILLNLNVIPWKPMYGIINTIIGKGSLVYFLITLYSKQK